MKKPFVDGVRMVGSIACDFDADAKKYIIPEDATTMGAVFVDIADSFKDGSGYLNTKYSTGGYNLNHNYYPFFLNKLAGAAK